MDTQSAAATPEFRPAWFDFATCTIYLSRHADGRLAPVHLPGGLPDALVAARSPDGAPVTLKPSVVAGYERKGFFFTRAAAARAAADWFVPSLSP